MHNNITPPLQAFFRSDENTVCLDREFSERWSGGWGFSRQGGCQLIPRLARLTVITEVYGRQHGRKADSAGTIAALTDLRSEPEIRQQR